MTRRRRIPPGAEERLCPRCQVRYVTSENDPYSICPACQAKEEKATS